MSDSTNGTVGTPSAEEVEWAIDTIDRLRVTIRRAGLCDGADALDQAFVQCLRDYMASKPAEAKGDEDDAVAGNLN